ncbi:MAG: ABC transporter permease subunit [Saprospiraceae bacterium]|nr:ABC transporter permease subunit [Saprospiraceae bacterium]
MASLAWLFDLRGEVKGKSSYLLLGLGLGFLLFIWVILTMGAQPLVPSGILPQPVKVVNAFGDLWYDNDLLRNVTTSYALNLGGYVKALLWSIPLGFLIGLFPLFRGSFQHIVNALRYLPLTAVTSLFIVWFGIYTEMKMNFLAFGIFLYLLPTIIQRIDEVEDVYLTTVYTLGASKWQTFTSVYFPAVMSKLSDDIRVLTAISWTYIIVIENIGSEGGIGFLLHGPSARQGRVDKMFALLILIMLIGVAQDRVFKYLDRKLFPHKYQLKENAASKSQTVSLLSDTLGFIGNVVAYASLFIYMLLAINEVTGIFGHFRPLHYFFGDRLWVINLGFLMVAFVIVYRWIKNKIKA